MPYSAFLFSLAFVFGCPHENLEKTKKTGKKSTRVDMSKENALINKLYPSHNTIINTYTHKVVVLCFE